MRSSTVRRDSRDLRALERRADAQRGRSNARRIERKIQTRYDSRLKPRSDARAPRSTAERRTLQRDRRTTETTPRTRPGAAPRAVDRFDRRDARADTRGRSGLVTRTRAAKPTSGRLATNARLTPRDVVSRRTTPIRPTPRLTTRTGRSPITPRLVRPSARRIATGSRTFYGHTHWGHHYASLSSCFGFGFGGYGGYAGFGGFGRGWGCYSYPFFFGAHLPRYYSHCYGALGSFGYRSYGFGFNLWLWPRSCWYPSRWIFGPSLWCDPYDLYYVPSRSYVTVEHDPGVVVGVPTADAEVVADSAPADADSIADAEAARRLETARRHIALGDFYFRDGRYVESAESYMRALTYAPDDGSLHFLIADALFAQGDYPYAAYMIRKALDRDPDLAYADVDKREFYGEAKTFDEQVATLRGYLEDKPYDAAAWLVLGYNLRLSNDDAGARSAFERVLEIQPDDGTARIFLDAIVAPAGPADGDDAR